MPWLKDIMAKEKRQTITEKQPPEKEYQKTFPYCDYLYAFFFKKSSFSTNKQSKKQPLNVH